MKKPVLVVMAAGMGSRYGGLKQIDPVGSCGEAILDFSLFDAHEAGFETAVIIIKEAIRKDFMDTVGKRLEKCPMEIRYAYQELDKIPEGFGIPAERTKPWGTSHAVFCAKEVIDGAPFAVINADDYYGKSAFKEIYHFLANNQDDEKYRYCMVGYELGNTVTDNSNQTACGKIPFLIFLKQAKAAVSFLCSLFHSEYPLPDIHLYEQYVRNEILYGHLPYPVRKFL